MRKIEKAVLRVSSSRSWYCFMVQGSGVLTYVVIVRERVDTTVLIRR